MIPSQKTKHMSELDEAWAAALSEAEQKHVSRGARMLPISDVEEFRTTCCARRVFSGLSRVLRLLRVRRTAPVRVFRSPGPRGIGLPTERRRWLATSSRSPAEFAHCLWKRAGRACRVTGSCEVVGLACANLRHMGRRAGEEFIDKTTRALRGLDRSRKTASTSHRTSTATSPSSSTNANPRSTKSVFYCPPQAGNT